MGVALILIENLILSSLEEGIAHTELNCLLQDLRQLYEAFISDRLFYLKLKSFVERGERYANQFTQGIIDVFQDNVLMLGRALHIDEHSVMVFSESFVRFHLIF